MTNCAKKNETLEVLLAARQIADFANILGVNDSPVTYRFQYNHLGAVIADSVLQAGLNYTSVVRPRVARILNAYPYTTTIDKLLQLVDNDQTGHFLNWNHIAKKSRFNLVVRFMHDVGINEIGCLRRYLHDDIFCSRLQNIHGIGPKTVDYMACLVGIESIAVDRHIRNFAKRVGIETSDYQFLKRVFCVAADLLSVSRRDFDAWVWRREAHHNSRQLQLAI